MWPRISAMNRTANLRQLHLGNVSSEKGKQQQKARHRDGNAASDGKPIDKLLAEVKASGGRMLVFDEAATLLQPFDVHLFRKIVPEENHGDQDEPCHK